MITITNLKDAKTIGIGEHFIFGKYAGYPIEWIKVSEESYIAACILEKMQYGEVNNYKKSLIRIWCNELGEKLKLANDSIYIPRKHEFIKWLIRTNELKCDYSDELKERGEDDGNPIFWTDSLIKIGRLWYARTITSTGSFSRNYIKDDDVGVRPVIHIG